MRKILEKKNVCILVERKHATFKKPMSDENDMYTFDAETLSDFGDVTPESAIYELIESGINRGGKFVLVFVLRNFVVVIDDAAGFREPDLFIALHPCGTIAQDESTIGECELPWVGCAIPLSGAFERDSNGVALHVSSRNDGDVTVGCVHSDGETFKIEQPETLEPHEEFHEGLCELAKCANRGEDGTIIVIPRSEEVTISTIEELEAAQQEILRDIRERKFDKRLVNRTRLWRRYDGVAQAALVINTEQVVWSTTDGDDFQDERFAVYVQLDQPEDDTKGPWEYVQFEYLGDDEEIENVVGEGRFEVCPEDDPPFVSDTNRDSKKRFLHVADVKWVMPRYDRLPIEDSSRTYSRNRINMRSESVDDECCDGGFDEYVMWSSCGEVPSGKLEMLFSPNKSSQTERDYDRIDQNIVTLRRLIVPIMFGGPDDDESSGES